MGWACELGMYNDACGCHVPSFRAIPSVMGGTCVASEPSALTGYRYTSMCAAYGCVDVCVYVCERAREKKRERERERPRERKKEGGDLCARERRGRDRAVWRGDAPFQLSMGIDGWMARSANLARSTRRWCEGSHCDNAGSLARRVSDYLPGALACWLGICGY
jgi:hypothetical protein